MPTTIAVPAGFLDRVVNYLTASSMTAKKACDEIDVRRQAEKRAADLRAPLLQHMIAVGVVGEHQKEAAEAMLGSHAETLNLLKAAVDKLAIAKTSKTAADLGMAVPDGSHDSAPGTVKAGNYNSLTDPRIGRRTGELKESDRILLKAAGMTVPD